MTITRASLAIFISLMIAGLAQAQTTAPAIRLLGEPFESRAAGISLRPPAGATAIRGALGSGEVVEFRDDNQKWVVKLNRVLLEKGKPVPLTSWIDKDGKEYPGMLELTVDQFKVERPGATILRQDTTNIKDIKVGMMVAKYDFGLNTNIMQEAIIRADDLQYYILSMNSVAPRTGDEASDPGVKLAAETFAQMLDTVEVHDQFDLDADRAERLMRTKMLYVNLTERKLRSVLQPEQWFRLIRDDKDIGYTYEVEQIGRDLPRQGQAEIDSGPEGVLIGVRTRLIPEAGIQTDGESWLFSTFDRKVEAFSTLAYTQTPTGKTTSGEIGTSRWREKAVADSSSTIGGQKGVSLTTEYHLEVTKLGANSKVEPIERELPPYYLPQAIGKLLSLSRCRPRAGGQSGRQARSRRAGPGPHRLGRLRYHALSHA
jgi:hypothetical protein